MPQIITPSQDHQSEIKKKKTKQIPNFGEGK